MRNRAKCRLCGDIIESFHRTDYVSCKCDEISIDGGNQYWRASAKDFTNFIRVDDDGKEIEVTVIEKEESPSDAIPFQPSKSEMIEMLNEMRKRYESLPQEAMYAPITHADFVSLILLVTAIFKAE